LGPAGIAAQGSACLVVGGTSSVGDTGEAGSFAEGSLLAAAVAVAVAVADAVAVTAAAAAVAAVAVIVVAAAAAAVVVSAAAVVVDVVVTAAVGVVAGVAVGAAVSVAADIVESVAVHGAAVVVVAAVPPHPIREDEHSLHAPLGTENQDQFHLRTGRRLEGARKEGWVGRLQAQAEGSRLETASPSEDGHSLPLRHLHGRDAEESGHGIGP